MKHTTITGIIAGIIVVLVLANIFVYSSAFQQQESNQDSMSKTSVSGNFETKLKEKNLSKIEEIGFSLDKVLAGGPPKDGIPSIDNPKFIPIQAVDYIADNELVLALEYKGETKVYPFQILVFHEIVNDIVGGDPLAITYCPLCGTGIAYNRVIDGKAVEFGVSGKLFNSNLLMYDRKTDSYWTQIDGLAVTGPMAGYELEAVSINTVLWADWKDSHPEALVLSQDTGFNRQYGNDPYGDYYVNDDIWFPTNAQNTIVQSKEVIFGIEINGEYRAYLEKDIIETQPFSDYFAGVNLYIQRSEEGEIHITNSDTNEKIVFERGFWFSWYAFHPNTTVYGKDVVLQE